jgi:hypothetical protein
VAGVGAGTASAQGNEPNGDPPAAAAPIAQENTASADAAVANESDVTQGAGQEQEAAAAPGESGDTAEPADPSPDPAEAPPAGDPAGTDPGTSGETPAQTATSATEVEGDQAAAADASASQSSPANTTVTVSVATGAQSNPSVGQQNGVSAAAEAHVNAHVKPPNGSDLNQSANAHAEASQTRPSNTHVEVRVDSPGSSGPVTQVNSASASADAGTQSDSAGDQHAAAEAQVTQAAPVNTNVTIRLDSPGTNGAVTQANTAHASTAATTNAGGATEQASVSQTDAVNMHVSIRLDSPGDGGAVTQVNAAEATVAASAELADAIEVTADGSNTVVEIELGEGADVPEVPVAWSWEWLWNLDLSSPPDPEAIRNEIEAQLAAGSWEWAWVAGGAPASQDSGNTGAEAASQGNGESQLAGTWTWIWTWEVEGLEGWEWTWTWTSPPPCDCTWNWTWTWIWTGGEAAAAPPEDEVPEIAADAVVEQANTVAAGAVAMADADLEQAVEQAQEGSGGGSQAQESAQALELVQLVEASATASQLDAGNWAGVLGGSLAQLNGVHATAAASAGSSSEQAIVQLQLGEGSEQTQWAGQVVEILQEASAAAHASQETVSNWSESSGSHVEQSNLADAGATAAVDSEIEQTIAQGQAGNGSLQTQQAGQIAAVEQAHTALAAATQVNASNSNLSIGGAIVQVNVVVASATSTATSAGLQLIVQEAVGDGVVQHQEAWQALAVIQGGAAIADASQSQVTNANVSHVTPPQPGGHGGDGGWSAGRLPGSPPTLALASESPQPGASEAIPPVAAPAVVGDVAGASVPVDAHPVPAEAGNTRVSASDTGARAPAARVRPVSREAMDADEEEAAVPPPGAPPEPGALSGVSQGTSSSGPAATASREQLHVPELNVRSSSPAVRRPAAVGVVDERPG